MALAQRMSFFDGGFRYLKRDYLFSNVRHITWWEGIDRQTGSDGKPIPRYRSRLKVKLTNGKTVHIRANNQWSRTNSTILFDVHNVICDAAEKLMARSFDFRMDVYEREFAASGYLRWGKHQIALDGGLYYRNAYCFNLNDPQVRCMLYPNKLVAMLGHKRWWGRLFMQFVSSSEVLELERDRDCFLFLLRRHIGLYWPNEPLRIYRGTYADGTPVIPPAAAQGASGRSSGREETYQAPPRETYSQGPRAWQEEFTPPPPPPPPPPPKPRLGEEHYLGILEIKGNVEWPEVKSAYRSLAKRYHPDLMRGRGAAEAELKIAEEKLKTINEAYAWLEDYYRMKPKG